MRFEFDSHEDYDMVREAVHDGILYWIKMRQDAQGKITMNCDGTRTHYTVEECEERIGAYTEVLSTIERTPHMEWDVDGYKLTNAKYDSSMVIKGKKFSKNVIKGRRLA